MPEMQPDWVISIIIPVFRPEKMPLTELCRRIRSTMEHITSEYEIVLVDDSGEARKWDIIRELAEQNAHVRGLCLGGNYGQHNALLAGIRAARGGIIVTMDDDLQNPPEEMTKLFAALTPETDVVYGLPNIRCHGLWRNLGAATLKVILSYALGNRVAKWVSPFRAFRRDLRVGFEHYRGPDVLIDVLLTWSTSRFVAVSVDHRPRVRGRSTYTPRTLLKLALTMVAGFSAMPLRLSSLMGFVMAFFGFFTLAFVLLRYFISDVHIAGFTFLASVIAIFSGVQLLTLGIAGEYLARIHFRTMGRPTYVVREDTSAASLMVGQ
jgi:glycosyltransferase involved in cell wall biosynthesis